MHEVSHTFNLQQTRKHYAFNTEMTYQRVHNDIATHTLDGPPTLWDATLSKEFKGLAITLKIHDILARSHSFTTTMDSFQRTERSAGILPRYAMLTLTYNFNWIEKRK